MNAKIQANAIKLRDMATAFKRLEAKLKSLPADFAAREKALQEKLARLASKIQAAETWLQAQQTQQAPPAA
jgi:hypothetical protein